MGILNEWEKWLVGDVRLNERIARFLILGQTRTVDTQVPLITQVIHDLVARYVRMNVFDQKFCWFAICQVYGVQFLYCLSKSIMVLWLCEEKQHKAKSFAKSCHYQAPVDLMTVLDDMLNSAAVIILGLYRQ